MSEIRILLVDDHAMFRAGIKALLESESRMTIVGEASSGDEAVDQVRALKPDVVVMDLSMPESNGLEATRRIAALGLDTRVLVLTVHAEEEYLVPVVEAGASGYLTKTSADTDLIEAIKVVARGEVFLPPKATRLLLQQYRSAETNQDTAGAGSPGPHRRGLLLAGDREEAVHLSQDGGYLPGAHHGQARAQPPERAGAVRPPGGAPEGDVVPFSRAWDDAPHRSRGVERLLL